MLKNWFLKFNKLTATDKIYYSTSASFFIFLVIFRLHNAWSFNPYWGYDGGDHLNYIFSLAQNNKLSGPETNTLAWHEPLYYFLMAGAVKLVSWLLIKINIIKFLSLLQAVLSLATSWLIFKLVKRLTNQRAVILLAIVLINLLPSFNQASTFVTNELLNYFFIFLSLYYFLTVVQRKEIGYKQYLILGLILSLGLLTKVTAIIIAFFILIYFFIEALKGRDQKIGYGLLLILLLLIIINSPWQIYKINHLGGMAINNTQMLTPQPLKFDSRLKFFYQLDPEIFIFPYWYAGGRSFSEMVYADIFYDYYGTIENKEFLKYLLANNPGQLVKTTLNNTYVWQFHRDITAYLVWLGLPLLLILIYGWGGSLAGFIRNKKTIDLFYFLVPGGFLAGLVYFSYRYPYYDSGIVKAIFIFPALALPLIIGLDNLFKISKKTVYILAPLVLIYCLLTVGIYWVVKFNY